MNLTILGAGAWGTALAVALGRHHRVNLWTRDPEAIKTLLETRENTKLLPGFILPEKVEVQGEFEVAVRNVELLIIATPLSGFRGTLERLKAIGSRTPFLWVCKGLEAGSSKLPHEIVAEVLGDNVIAGVLTGPSFAQEVAQGLPTAITLASRDTAFSSEIVQSLHTPRLRFYAHDDVPGAEIGGAVKNVMAIAAGISDGLGFGYNARAGLITRGLAEIARLGVAIGGKMETFMGLAGMGDLVLTCTGDLSRNRQAGLALAAGRKLADIIEELGHVAEGVSSAREVSERARRLGVDMPITQAVEAILYENMSPQEAVTRLLNRDPKPEFMEG